MVRYPYDLYVEVVTPGGKDENGFDTGETSDLVFWAKCYDQVLSKAEVHEAENGRSYTCRSKVFTPKVISPIKIGSRIEVREKDGSVRLTGEVGRFSTDYKHFRIWV